MQDHVLVPADFPNSTWTSKLQIRIMHTFRVFNAWIPDF